MISDILSTDVFLHNSKIFTAIIGRLFLLLCDLSPRGYIVMAQTVGIKSAVHGDIPIFYRLRFNIFCDVR